MKSHRPERKMREFSYLHEKYVHKNYLKYLRLASPDMAQHVEASTMMTLRQIGSPSV